MKILVSACLVGDNCKYNGGNNLNAALVEFSGGSFSGRKIEGQGIFEALFIKAGYKVLDIEDFEC